MYIYDIYMYILHIYIYIYYIYIDPGIYERKQCELELLASCFHNHAANL